MVLLRLADGGALSTTDSSLSLDALVDESDIIVQQEAHDQPTRQSSPGSRYSIAYQARSEGYESSRQPQQGPYGYLSE